MRIDYRIVAWLFLIAGLAVAASSFIEDIRPHISNAMLYGGIALFILSFFMFAVQDILDDLTSYHRQHPATKETVKTKT